MPEGSTSSCSRSTAAVLIVIVGSSPAASMTVGSAILFVAAIFFFVLREAAPILVNEGFSLAQFLFSTEWYPTSATNVRYGTLALTVGTFSVTALAMLLAVPFGPLLAWKRGDLIAAAQRLIGAALLAVIALVVTFLVQGKPVLAALGIGLAVFVIAGALTDIAERTGVFRTSPGNALRRAVGLPQSAWGAAFAHLGLGLMLIGVIGESQWNSERIVAMKVGDKLAIGGYELSFDGAEQKDGPNYRELVTTFTASRDGKVIGTMTPAKRTFAHREMSTTEAALKARGLSQIYLSLGDIGADGSVAVRAFYKPLVLLIWFGALVMAMGGALSLSDRRLRIGAPRPAKSKAKSALAPAE